MKTNKHANVLIELQVEALGVDLDIILQMEVLGVGLDVILQVEALGVGLDVILLSCSVPGAPDFEGTYKCLLNWLSHECINIFSA